MIWVAILLFAIWPLTTFIRNEYHDSRPASVLAFIVGTIAIMFFGLAFPAGFMANRVEIIPDVEFVNPHVVTLRADDLVVTESNDEILFENGCSDVSETKEDRFIIVEEHMPSWTLGFDFVITTDIYLCLVPFD